MAGSLNPGCSSIDLSICTMLITLSDHCLRLCRPAQLTWHLLTDTTDTTADRGWTVLAAPTDIRSSLIRITFDCMKAVFHPR